MDVPKLTSYYLLHANHLSEQLQNQSTFLLIKNKWQNIYFASITTPVYPNNVYPIYLPFTNYIFDQDSVVKLQKMFVLTL